MEENFKRLVKELGNAINDSLADSEKIGDVLGKIRTAGYDVFLVLEVTIGFNKRDAEDETPEEKSKTAKIRGTQFRLTNQDAQFLRALKISVEKERK